MKLIQVSVPRQRLGWEGWRVIPAQTVFLTCSQVSQWNLVKRNIQRRLKGKGSAYLPQLGWGMSLVLVTFVSSSWCHCLKYLSPCQLLSETWSWSWSDSRLMKAWARLNSSLCWSLGSLWGVGYSESFGKGRIEAFRYLVEVEGVLRIEAREEKRMLKGCPKHPGAGLGLHRGHYYGARVYRTLWCAFHEMMPPPLPEMPGADWDTAGPAVGVGDSEYTLSCRVP